MEKLSLDKFADKKLENANKINGGETLNTTWKDSYANGEPTGARGIDWYDTETDKVFKYATIVF